MTGDGEIAMRPARRTNAERSAATRKRLITAAIECLYELGYAATSTPLIAARAKVSRGAMLHQFPTKVDLTLAVAEYVIASQREFYYEHLMRLRRGRARYLAITELAWEAWSQPSGIAVIEIMMAVRSDPVLKVRFEPVAKAIVRSQRDDIWEIAKAAGITDRDEVEASAQLNTAAIKGLCIDLMYTTDRRPIERAMKLLMKYKHFTADELVARAAGVDLVLAAKPPTEDVDPEDAELSNALKLNTESLKQRLADALLADPSLQELIRQQRKATVIGRRKAK